MAVRNAFSEMAKEHVNAHGDAHLVSGNKKKWRREFNAPLATFWDKVESGIIIPDPAAGTVTVNMGTTINAESWMVSKETFSFPVKAAVCIQLSQKIANNEVYLELVGINELTGDLDETKVAAWRISGTDVLTVTNARTEVRNGAAARRQSANVNTQPQTGAPVIMEITAESDEVWFASKGVDSLSARSVANVMNLVTPDPESDYKLRIRFKNGTAAPASATNVQIFFALVVDYTEQQIEVTGGNGNTQPAQSLPVNVVAAIPGTTQVGGAVTPQASATGNGTSAAKVLAAASTNPTLLKATAGRLYGYQLANLTASWKFVRFYNKATAPVVGTDSPFLVVPVPPGNLSMIYFDIPVSFPLGIGYSITGAVADLDATAVAVSDVQGTVYWV